MSFFLRARHWQLFVIMIAIPCLLILGSLISTVVTQDLKFLIWVAVAIFIANAAQLCWYYIVGNGLYKRLPETVRMNIVLFRILVVIPWLYGIIAGIVIIVVFTQHGFDQPTRDFPYAILLVIPLNLLAMFCTLYQFYFLAKTLKAVELQKPVTTSDYIGDFVMVWFFFVGVWFLQPRINKIFGKKEVS